jgi:hypothetical protein
MTSQTFPWKLLSPGHENRDKNAVESFEKFDYKVEEIDPGHSKETLERSTHEV